MFESAIDNAVLRLMHELFAKESVAARFYQAGGTALALLRGHRRSVDIDLFATEPFDEESIVRLVSGHEGVILARDRGTVHGLVGAVRVSFLHYPYPLLRPEIRLDTIRLASIDDIAAMKVVAVSQRAEKKDFFDMHEILKTMSAAQVKAATIGKFGSAQINCYHALRSFFFFDDAEDSPDPISLNGTTWPQVKTWFQQHERELTSALLC